MDTGFSEHLVKGIEQSMAAAFERSTAHCISEMNRVFDYYNRRSEARRLANGGVSLIGVSVNHESSSPGVHYEMEKKVSEIKSDDRVKFGKDFEAEIYCYKPEQWVNVFAEDGHTVSVLEDKSNVLEENTLADENKYAVAIEEGHRAATLKNNVSTGDSYYLLQDETSMAGDIAATIRAPALLIEENPVAPPKKKDESSESIPLLLTKKDNGSNAESSLKVCKDQGQTQSS